MTFLLQLETPHKEVWDERIVDYKIEIDENLAQVWAPYEFYLDDKFSHCGVNAFQLIKNKWCLEKLSRLLILGGKMIALEK